MSIANLSTWNGDGFLRCKIHFISRLRATFTELWTHKFAKKAHRNASFKRIGVCATTTHTQATRWTRKCYILLVTHVARCALHLDSFQSNKLLHFIFANANVMIHLRSPGLILFSFWPRFGEFYETLRLIEFNKLSEMKWRNNDGVMDDFHGPFGE